MRGREIGIPFEPMDSRTPDTDKESPSEDLVTKIMEKYEGPRLEEALKNQLIENLKEPLRNGPLFFDAVRSKLPNVAVWLVDDPEVLKAARHGIRIHFMNDRPDRAREIGNKFFPGEDIGKGLKTMMAKQFGKALRKRREQINQKNQE